LAKERECARAVTALSQKGVADLLISVMIVGVENVLKTNLGVGQGSL
jgi:hypothetical protein